MQDKEKQLFWRLCSFNTSTFDEGLLEAATPSVLGHLFFNRMHTVAYSTLKEFGLLNGISREFRNSLKIAFDHNIAKNQSFFKCVKYVGEVLCACQCDYAMLKGAYLCKYYPEGLRTSNDIDLLVRPMDVTKVGAALTKAGFTQGSIRNGKFVPATRKEIIESKMLRGETVPYFKEINLPGMQFLEVDINFSLDYKPENTENMEKMLQNTTVEQFGDFSVRTLRKDDFFVHLCTHLYKEATTMPWIEMARDMTLYKYADIYMLLHCAQPEDIESIFERAKELSVEKICAFAVIQTSRLFNDCNEFAKDVAASILKNDPLFIHTVVAPKQKKEYVFAEKDIKARFFMSNRKYILEEKNNENFKYENQ